MKIGGRMIPVLVSIKSIQRNYEGEDTSIELVAPGKYYERNGVKYIIYEESSINGLEGTKTTIKVYPRSIVLIRSGSVRMRHEYILGEEKETDVDLGFGLVTLKVKTHEMKVAVKEGVGDIHLGYDLAINGDWEVYNQLIIHLQEDHVHGCEEFVASSYSGRATQSD